MCPTTFHGDSVEGFDLQVAFSHHCTCEFDETSGARKSCCPVHDLMLHDQKTLDRLLFERRIVATLMHEEFR